MTQPTIEERLRNLGLVLPAPVIPPPGARLPFAPVRVRGNRAYISGTGRPTWTAVWPGHLAGRR